MKALFSKENPLIKRSGVIPTVARWFKNSTAVALVSVEAQVQSPAQSSELKAQVAAAPQIYAEDVAIKKGKENEWEEVL